MIKQAASLQIQFIGAGVVCRRFDRWKLAEQFDLQRLNYGECNFILHVEDVFYLAIVSLRPEMINLCRVNKLGRDAYPIA